MNMTRGTVTHVNRGPSGHEVRRAAYAAALNALNSLQKLSNDISDIFMLDHFRHLLYLISFHIIPTSNYAKFLFPAWRNKPACGACT